MSDTNKSFSEYDQTQILQKVYNPAEGVLATGTFLSARVGNQIAYSSINSTTEAYSFYEGVNLLYVLTIVYTDSSKAQISTATRTA